MIYILPGMGADHTMFRDDWLSLPDCVFLDWPAYRGEPSLSAIAARMVREAGILDGSVVVGHSLGGMVSCEIARLRDLRELVLMGSARRKEEISRLLAVLHPLAAYTPFKLTQAIAQKFPGDLFKMFARSDPDFIRATCRAIFEWEGLDESRITPRRIHGRDDQVIPMPPEADLILDGGHMIPLTHARECVAFLRSLL
jgi:pimeloyl-ACP methyl ester carboxylesterase